MDKSTDIFRSQGFVLIAILTLLVLVNTNAYGGEQDRNTRNAFMLGFVYGNGHNLFSQNPTLQGKAKTIYNAWMSDAKQYASTLGVSVDTNPPSYNPSSTKKRSDIIRAGRNKAELLAIQIVSRHNKRAAVALQLGYRSAIEIEILPYINRSTQTKIAAEYKRFAIQVGLPVHIVEKYTNTLRSTKNRKVTVKAMFTFKDDVLRYYEGLTMADKTGFLRQLNIWSMGWSLGLATIGQTRGADPAMIARVFDKCRTRADLLGVSLPMLPEASTDTARDTARAIHYLLNEAGDNIGGELKAKYGPRASSLFELSIKSTLALLLYGPEDGMGQTFTTVIERSGRNAGLPVYIYQPLVDKMRSKAPYSVIKQEISSMDQRIRNHLMSGIK